MKLKGACQAKRQRWKAARSFAGQSFDLLKKSPRHVMLSNCMSLESHPPYSCLRVWKWWSRTKVTDGTIQMHSLDFGALESWLKTSSRAEKRPIIPPRIVGWRGAFPGELDQYSSYSSASISRFRDVQITRGSSRYVSYGNRYGICLFRLPTMAPSPTSIFCRKYSVW